MNPKIAQLIDVKRRLRNKMVVLTFQFLAGQAAKNSKISHEHASGKSGGRGSVFHEENTSFSTF
jgi:hypothetical protein